MHLNAPYARSLPWCCSRGPSRHAAWRTWGTARGRSMTAKRHDGSFLCRPARCGGRLALRRHIAAQQPRHFGAVPPGGRVPGRHARGVLYLSLTSVLTIYALQMPQLSLYLFFQHCLSGGGPCGLPPANLLLSSRCDCLFDLAATTFLPQSRPECPALLLHAVPAPACKPVNWRRNCKDARTAL